MALVMALAAAILVSVTAWGVLNLTWQRFQASAVRTDRMVALAASEAGLRYILTRLDLDPALRAQVEADGRLASPVDYAIACHPNPHATAAEIAGTKTVAALHMGGGSATNPGKHVTIRLLFLTAPPDLNRPYEVRVFADFAEG